MGRRETLYRMLGKRNNGTVPCFVCGRHVREKNATLEHIIPISKGGTDDMDNLSISHFQCNQRRGMEAYIDLFAYMFIACFYIGGFSVCYELTEKSAVAAFFWMLLIHIQLAVLGGFLFLVWWAWARCLH